MRRPSSLTLRLILGAGLWTLFALIVVGLCGVWAALSAVVVVRVVLDDTVDLLSALVFVLGACIAAFFVFPNHLSFGSIIIVAVIFAAVGVWLLLWRTRSGYALRATGCDHKFVDVQTGVAKYVQWLHARG